MVISESKVNLASKRLYSETFSQGRFTTAGNGRNQIYARSGANFSSSYSTAENYSNDSVFYKNSRKYSMGEHAKDSAYYGLFAYSRNAKLVADDIMNKNAGANSSNGNITEEYGSSGAIVGSDNDNENSAAADSVKNAASAPVSLDNAGSLYNTARERIFFSLLEILRRLSFRGDFEDFYNRSYYSGSINQMSNSGNVYNAANTSGASDTLSITNSGDASAWTVKETYSTFYGEAEYTSFSGNGTIVTADGREIGFDVNMEMSRSYMEQSNLTYITKFPRVLTDPLIINLDCNPVDIQDKTFLFDLDCDGEKEEIAALSGGSGYLALDINGDGVINDGSELFGTASGDGFKDLAAYDSDGNGWIDEADDVYKSLKVWTTDANGEPVLMSLKDADVGAIYLGSSKTQFDLKDDNNELKGRVRSSGVYLHEDGTAGTIQQVDF